MKDWKAELGFEIVKHEPEGQMPVYLVREDFAEDREATITERVLWDALREKPASGEPVADPHAYSRRCAAAELARGPWGKHAAQPAPARAPLMDAEVDELARTMVKGNKSVNWLCRAIEAAHGITAESQSGRDWKGGV